MGNYLGNNWRQLLPKRSFLRPPLNKKQHVKPYSGAQMIHDSILRRPILYGTKTGAELGRRAPHAASPCRNAGRDVDNLTHELLFFHARSRQGRRFIPRPSRVHPTSIPRPQQSTPAPGESVDGLASQSGPT